MEKKLRTAMLVTLVPLVIVFTLIMSKQFFDITLNNEIALQQNVEQLIATDVKKQLLNEKDYEKIVAKIKDLEKQHSNKTINIKILYGDKYISKEEVPNHIKAMIKPQICAMIYTKADEPLLLIAEPINDKITLVLQKNIGYIYKQKEQINKNGIIITLMFIAIICLISWFISKKHTRPIKKLSLATKEIAKGNKEIELPVETQDEIGELSLAFQKMQNSIINREDELKEEIIKKQKLLNALAHEMRTPICSILGNARLIQSVDISKEDTNNCLESICKEAKLLSNMDKQLMEAIDIETDIEKENISLLEVFQTAKERLLLQETSINIEIIGEDKTIYANKDMLIMLISNLLTNSVRVSKLGDKIILGTLNNGFFVQDFGKGMNEEEINHVFEPFYKADKVRTRKFGGAGLGLSICKQIAKKHGADITIKSNINCGTTVTYIQN